MGDIKNPKYQRELVKLHQNRINAFNRHMAKQHQTVLDNYKLYKDGMEVDRDNYYSANLTYSLIKGLIPSLVVSDPDIIVEPKKAESLSKIPVIEKVSNYYWRELDIKDQVKKCVLDSFLAPFSIIKTGWNFQLKKLDKVMDPQKNIGGQTTLEPNEYLKKDEPFARRISFLNFIFDLNATCLEETHWLGEKVCKRLWEVQQDERYDKKVRQELKATGKGYQSILEQMEGTVSLEEDPEQFVSIYEVHDRERDLLLTISLDHEMPLRIIKYPYPNLEGTHYETLYFDEIPDTMLGQAPINRIRDQQKMYNRIRTMQFDHVQKNVPKYGYNKSEGDIKKEEIIKWANGEANSIIGVSGDPEQEIKQFTVAPIPQDQYSMAEISKEDMRNTLGAPPSRVGDIAGSRTTASEIQSLNSAEQFRIEDSKAAVENFSAKITRNLIQIMSTQLTDEKTLMIVGEDDFIPLKVSKKEVQGEFGFSVRSGSMAKADRGVERQQLINIVNLLAPIPGANIMPVVKELLKTFSNLKINPNEVFPTGDGSQTPGSENPRGREQEDLRKQGQGAPDEVSNIANLINPNNSRGA